MKFITQIYLLRHAESAPCSATEERLWPLSGRGQQQAKNLVAHLSGLGIEHIYSSPYRRALDTVLPFAEAGGISIVEERDLRERYFSPGLLPNFLELMQQAWKDLDFALPGCESGNQAQARACRLLTRVSQRHTGQTILLSSHGNLIGLILKSLAPDFGYQNWRAMRNPELFRLCVREGHVFWDRDFVFL